MLSTITNNTLGADPDMTAKAVVEKLINELSQHNAHFEPQNHEWTQALHNSIIYLTATRRGLTTAQIYALAVMRRRWDELPLSFRLEYNNDFWFYGCYQTGRQIKRLQELVSAVEIFFMEEVKPFGSVPVPVRNDNGVPTGEMEYKPFNPLDVDPSKLVAARSRAIQNQMTPQLWGMLLDDQVTITELHLELTGGTDENGRPADMSLKFRLSGPLLVATENGIEVELGEITCWSEYYDDLNSLEHRAITRLCMALGIKMDEQIIMDKDLRDRRTNGYGE